jgi:hypothetical protein
MAELRTVIAELRRMGDGQQIPRIMRAELAKASRPFAPLVRAAILNTPATGHKHTGLRLRIARCVETWAVIDGPVVQVGVEMNASRMPDGEKSLPLMLEGPPRGKRWRHPVFGDPEVWTGQLSHPYFWGAVSAFGPASRNAMNRAADSIARKIGLSRWPRFAWCLRALTVPRRPLTGSLTACQESSGS